MLEKAAAGGILVNIQQSDKPSTEVGTRSAFDFATKVISVGSQVHQTIPLEGQNPLQTVNFPINTHTSRVVSTAKLPSTPSQRSSAPILSQAETGVKETLGNSSSVPQQAASETMGPINPVIIAPRVQQERNASGTSQRNLVMSRLMANPSPSMATFLHSITSSAPVVPPTAVALPPPVLPNAIVPPPAQLGAMNASVVRGPRPFVMGPPLLPQPFPSGLPMPYQPSPIPIVPNIIRQVAQQVIANNTNQATSGVAASSTQDSKVRN